MKKKNKAAPKKTVKALKKKAVKVSGDKSGPKKKHAPKKKTAKATVKKKSAPKKPVEKAATKKPLKKTAPKKAASPVKAVKAKAVIKPKTAIPKPKLPAKSSARKAPAPQPEKKPAAMPVRTAPVMDDARRDALRRSLLHRRQRLVEDINAEVKKYISGDSRQIVESVLDSGDWSTIDLSEDINLKKLETMRSTLQKIDEAIRKLNEGTYGICEDCGDEIAQERLKVLPFAIFCRDCQENREVIEAIEKASESRGA